MKKYLILTAVSFFLFLGPHLAWAADTTSTNFVPLTNIPAVTQIANDNNLGFFFNNLYKICIGAAATLAVFQLMLAGFTWMTAGGNSENVSKARSKIGNALFGLLLVLSPAIVFGIINPRILDLSLDFESLTSNPNAGTTQTTTPTTPATTTPQSIKY